MSELQTTMHKIVIKSEYYILCLNTPKTNVLVFSKIPQNTNVKIKGEEVDQRFCFKYLSTSLNDQSNPKKEILSVTASKKCGYK